MEEGYEYPTEVQEAMIRNWDTLKTGVKPLIDYVESLWWAPDWGFKLYRGKEHLFGKKSVIKLQLHTGGWSGNESIIAALQSNMMFWWLCWRKSVVGGHYWFEFRSKDWKRELSDAPKEGR